MKQLFVSNIKGDDKMSSIAKKSGFIDVTKIGYVILGILVILLALAAVIYYYSTSSFSGITAMSGASRITAMSGSSFRFVVWADTKTGTSILLSESQSIINNGMNPTFTLYLGDLCDSGPDATCFATWKSAMNGGNTNDLFNITFATRGKGLKRKEQNCRIWP
jgi:hypothetical protein